uniref:Uncharacterized protein n=1 Tax=Ditylenchus dipsaci TaxID=166011 RepID=A0A915CXG1_9BILA
MSKRPRTSIVDCATFQQSVAVTPNVIEHVLRGGQIPGIPAETLSAVVKQYMQQAYYSTASATQINGPAPLSPPNVCQLSSEPVDSQPASGCERTTSEEWQSDRPTVSQSPPNDAVITSQLQLEQAAATGHEVSDGRRDAGPVLLPMDLQQYLRDNIDRLFSALSATASNVSIDEILRKLPRFEQPVLGATFSPYDINQIDAMLVVNHKESHHISATQVSYARLYTAIALGMVGATTLVILGLFCYYLRRNRFNTTTSTTITTGQY